MVPLLPQVAAPSVPAWFLYLAGNCAPAARKVHIIAAYALAHLAQATMGAAFMEYLERIDATLAPFGGHFLVHSGR